MDVFKLHGIGGMVGSFLTGIFATSSSKLLHSLPLAKQRLTNSVSELDGVTIASAGIDGNGIQVGKQFAEITAISAYSFLVSCALLYILKFILGMQLRVTEEAEM
jgi:ammonium transporter, Amt family